MVAISISALRISVHLRVTKQEASVNNLSHY